jgi:hypothetical protein
LTRDEHLHPATSRPAKPESAHAADVVASAGRSDRIGPALTETRVVAIAERPYREGNGTRATPTRSSHDFDLAGTAVRCSSRAKAAAAIADAHAYRAGNPDRPALRLANPTGAIAASPKRSRVDCLADR